MDESGLFPIFLGLLTAGAGALLIAFILRDLQRSAQSQDWPEVKGRILSSESVREDTGEGVLYRAEVKYEYVADGVRYEASRIRFGASPRSQDRADKDANAYPKGAEVYVYFNPDKPDVCVLEPGVKPGFSVLGFVVGIALFGGGIFFFTRGF